jgi:hypothetical protein
VYFKWGYSHGKRESKLDEKIESITTFNLFIVELLYEAERRTAGLVIGI